MSRSFNSAQNAYKFVLFTLALFAIFTSALASAEDEGQAAAKTELKPIRGYWGIIRSKSVLDGSLALKPETQLAYDNAVRSYGNRDKTLKTQVADLKAKIAESKSDEEKQKLRHELGAANKAIDDNKITGYAKIMNTLSMPQRERVAGMQLYLLAARKFSSQKFDDDKKKELRKMCFMQGRAYLKAKLENSEMALDRVKDLLYAKVEKTLVKSREAK